MKQFPLSEHEEIVDRLLPFNVVLHPRAAKCGQVARLHMVTLALPCMLWDFRVSLRVYVFLHAPAQPVSLILPLLILLRSVGPVAATPCEVPRCPWLSVGSSPATGGCQTTANRVCPCPGPNPTNSASLTTYNPELGLRRGLFVAIGARLHRIRKPETLNTEKPVPQNPQTLPATSYSLKSSVQAQAPRTQETSDSLL